MKFRIGEICKVVSGDHIGKEVRIIDLPTMQDKRYSTEKGVRFDSNQLETTGKIDRSGLYVYDLDFEDIPQEKQPDPEIWKILVREKRFGCEVYLLEDGSYAVRFPDLIDVIPFQFLALDDDIGIYDIRKVRPKIGDFVRVKKSIFVGRKGEIIDIGQGTFLIKFSDGDTMGYDIDMFEIVNKGEE